MKPEGVRQERIVAQMGKMLKEMKADWESKPENAGKEISHSELWEIYGRKISGESNSSD